MGAPTSLARLRLPAMNPYERLLSNYRQAINRQDWDAASELFVPGARIELDLGERGVQRFGNAPDAMAFVANAVSRFSGFELRILDATVLDPSGAALGGTSPHPATGVCVIQEVRTLAATGEGSTTIGRYRDELVTNSEGELRFQRRHYRSLLVLGVGP
jgi:hypothetical protein